MHSMCCKLKTHDLCEMCLWRMETVAYLGIEIHSSLFSVTARADPSFHKLSSVQLPRGM